MDKLFDIVIKNARVVRPNKTAVDCLDIAIKDGKIARLAPEIQAERAQASFRRQKSSGVPGLRRCAHAYRHLCAARPGRGVREQGRGHGRRHLKPELPAHRALLPQPRRPVPRVHARSATSNRRGASGSTTAFTWRRSNRRTSTRWTISSREHGVTSFKIFMFYGGYGLHGASSQQNEFLMIGPDERYDIAHFEFIMRSAQRLMEKYPDQAAAHQRQPALRTRGNPQRLYQDRRARGQADRACRPTAPRGRRIRKGLPSGLHLIWPTRPIA